MRLLIVYYHDERYKGKSQCGDNYHKQRFLPGLHAVLLSYANDDMRANSAPCAIISQYEEFATRGLRQCGVAKLVAHLLSVSELAETDPGVELENRPQQTRQAVGVE